MSYPKIGTKAPDFNLSDQEGKLHKLADYFGKNVLLYFYPKEDTPGCTQEACEFRDNYNELQKLGLVIIGISKDSVLKHKKFKEKYSLPFTLLSDTEGSVCESYGTWQKKKFMGREYMGIARASFLIDKEGKIKKVYENVKPKLHAKEVLEESKKII